MSEDLRNKLAEELDDADWSMLGPHCERGVVFVVDPSLDILDVSVALAEDKIDLVKSWLHADKIRKPNPEEIKAWKADPYQKLGQVLIIQPYVLLQPLPTRTELH